MLKRFTALLICTICLMPAWSQVQDPTDGTFMVSRDLWNSSYMPKNRDQFVHGEAYRLYPGPLPKVLYAMGQDTKSLPVDWEMLVNLDRNAPSWYGICNGWAASSLIFDEPGAIVVNGVKILPGDHKSFLTTIYKDTTAQYFGSTDPVTGGMTPESFEQILFRFVVEEDQSLVFDVALNDEVWNYPIKGFIRESREEGPWTYVKITALFPGLIPVNDSFDQFFTQEFIYEFRFNTANKNSYEWIGDSVEDHPQIAWLPRFPWLKGVDVVNANHYYGLETYEELLALAGAENNTRDLQEPNDTVDTAFKINNELILGSLLLEDTDYYQIPVAAGEPVAFEFKVYDGQAINFEVLDPNGNAVQIANDTESTNVQFEGTIAGNYTIKISQKEDAFTDSYYQLVFAEDASHFVSGPFGNNVELEGKITAVNTRNTPVVLSSAQTQTLESFGSASYQVKQDTQIRGSDRTLWSETFDGQAGTFKQYFLDHQQITDYMVPHVTCRNGWKTHLEIRRQANSPVYLRVYGQFGVMLTRVMVPFGDNQVYQGDMATLVPAEVLESAAWIDFETTSKLKGFVVFSGLGGAPIRLDITAKPRFGDMLVFDLKAQGAGGTGLAIVSAAPEENEVLYWIENGDGEEIFRGSRFMQKGHKWLTTIDALVDVPMEDDFVFFMHSQFPVEGLVIQVGSDMIYGHRILGMDMDNLVESFVSVPENRDGVGYIFANFNRSSRHILFEGFAADGTLQGRFNIRLGRALRSREVQKVPLQQIFENGVDIKDLNAITHLRMTSVEKFFGLELVDFGQSNSPMVVPMKNVYENP